MDKSFRRLYDRLLDSRWVISDEPANSGTVCLMFTAWQGVRDNFCGGCSACRVVRPDLEACGFDAVADAIGQEKRPLSWVVGDQGVQKPKTSQQDRLMAQRQTTTIFAFTG